MVSDESQFNVSLTVEGQSRKTVSTDRNSGRERRAEAAMVEVLLYVHRNRRLIRDGGAQDGHLDFHTAPEL